MQEIMDTQIATIRVPRILSNRVVADVTNIVEEIEAQGDIGLDPETVSWSYQIPGPGVRYYSYQ